MRTMRWSPLDRNPGPLALAMSDSIRGLGGVRWQRLSRKRADMGTKGALLVSNTSATHCAIPGSADATVKSADGSRKYTLVRKRRTQRPEVDLFSAMGHPPQGEPLMSCQHK